MILDVEIGREGSRHLYAGLLAREDQLKKEVKRLIGLGLLEAAALVQSDLERFRVGVMQPTEERLLGVGWIEPPARLDPEPEPEKKPSPQLDLEDAIRPAESRQAEREAPGVAEQLAEAGIARPAEPRRTVLRFDVRPSATGVGFDVLEQWQGGGEGEGVGETVHYCGIPQADARSHAARLNWEHGLALIQQLEAAGQDEPDVEQERRLAGAAELTAEEWRQAESGGGPDGADDEVQPEAEVSEEAPEAGTPEPRDEAAPAPVATPERPGPDLTARGPYRWYLVPVQGAPERRAVVDRDAQDIVEEGPALNMLGLCRRLNGLDSQAEEPTTSSAPAEIAPPPSSAETIDLIDQVARDIGHADGYALAEELHDRLARFGLKDVLETREVAMLLAEALYRPECAAERWRTLRLHGASEAELQRDAAEIIGAGLEGSCSAGSYRAPEAKWPTITVTPRRSARYLHLRDRVLVAWLRALFGVGEPAAAEVAA